MLLAFLLGFTGSLGHCVGMCGGVTMLLSRRGVTHGWRLLVLHLGRLSTYSLLGALAGSLGLVTTAAMPGHTDHDMGSRAAEIRPELGGFQGVIALIAALVMLYFAFALLGKLPSPELLLASLTKHWGRMMRQATVTETPRTAGVFTTYGLGLLWGMLPCGLVLAAMFIAATAGSPLAGALLMFSFGLGTGPALLTLNWLSQHKTLTANWPRYAAATFIMIFSTQTALRGIAAFGWIDHLMVGEIMLW